MALRRKGNYWYGSAAEDIKTELVRYSRLNGYAATRFCESICTCGSRSFKLETDEDEGAAKRICTACVMPHLMGDSADYASAAHFEDHTCVCEGNVFQLLSGVALYGDSNDVRWYYIGCLCEKCNLVGVFADWKCDAGDADAFLAEC